MSRIIYTAFNRRELMGNIVGEWDVVASLVEALCYKPEDRGFDSRLGHCIFQLT
jgi:hypothetical protein